MLLLLSPDGPVSATTGDPAATQVQTLDASLLESMKAGPAEPMAERVRRLTPAITQVINLPLMAQRAVGPPWRNFSSEEKEAVIAAFSRFTIANYAHNFREYNGQQFVVDAVESRGEDKVVHARIVRAHDSPVELLYRMHEVDGVWKVIDVYSEGVSELALRRDDFGAALAAGGPAALIAHLNKVSDDLMK